MNHDFLCRTHAGSDGKHSTFLADIATVPDLHHDDREHVIVNLVDDTVNTFAESVPFPAGQLLASRRPRIFSQCFKAFQNPNNVLPGNGSKITGHGYLEDKFKFSHAP
jgi:hypothetical protein